MLERINLVPKKTSTDKFWFAAYGVLGAIVIISLAVIFIKKNMATKGIDEINTAMKGAIHKQENIEMLQNQVRKLQMDTKKHRTYADELRKQLAKHSSLKVVKYPYALLLQQITTALPKSAKCDRISFDKQSGSLSGSATNYEVLPTFVAHLKESNLFEAVSLKTVKGQGNLQNLAAFTFTLEFTIATTVKSTK